MTQILFLSRKPFPIFCRPAQNITSPVPFRGLFLGGQIEVRLQQGPGSDVRLALGS